MLRDIPAISAASEIVGGTGTAASSLARVTTVACLAIARRNPSVAGG